MNAGNLKGIFASISQLMTTNKNYLIELDQQNGDGDLGISMSEGYQAVCEYLATAEEKDLGKLLLKSSTIFNEAAPSSLGTITSFGMMGMAKALKGKEEADLDEMAQALKAGIDKIMEKAKSKPGEKTILDALYPGVEVFRANQSSDIKEVARLAFEAAAVGSENTKTMKSVHGRAAYYGEQTIGLLDGGSVVGKLIFEGIYSFYCK